MFTTASGRKITYYGHEYANEIIRIKGSNKIIKSIDELFDILLKSWCKKTAFPSCQSDYDFKNDPSYGQCAITAVIVYDMFGGTIHKVKFSNGGTHYFNKINGHYIDLTSDQFTLYNLPVDYEHNEEVPRQYCGKNADTAKRLKLLISQIGQNLHK